MQAAHTPTLPQLKSTILYNVAAALARVVPGADAAGIAALPYSLLLQSCYNDLKEGDIIAIAETAVRKADLKRKRNDEQAEV